MQKGILLCLPAESKLSIALDCWTSPFRQVFIAITGYFLDYNWNYCKVLLSFEPLEDIYSGPNLSKVVIQVLESHGIISRVLTITTDNASNNHTIIIAIQEVGKSLGISEDYLFQVPYITYII